MKIINLFAGPGAGKSTTAAMVFAALKRQNRNVELVTEYAKDVSWEQNWNRLNDQLFISANQNRRLDRLRNHGLDWIVTDSPLLLGLHYTTPDYLGGTYTQLMLELWNSYDNINFLIERRRPYNPVGRNQDYEGALAIDANIRAFLDENRLPYTVVAGEGSVDEVILEHLYASQG